MPPNENWIASFPVGNMLILRFFGFCRATSAPSPPLSSLSSLGLDAIGGCLLVARLLLGFVLVRVASLISLLARPVFVFCLLGCSTTWISSSSSEIAFLLPFFRAGGGGARSWSGDGGRTFSALRASSSSLRASIRSSAFASCFWDVLASVRTSSYAP